MPTSDPFHYQYKTEFEPVVRMGDYVEMIRIGGDAIDLRVDYVEGLGMLGEFNVIQSGTVPAGATSPVTKALIGGQDILQAGPDEFYQLRYQLNPTDWTAPSTADIKLNLYQPGPGQSRWSAALAVGFWDITAQNYWTSLHPTETYTWWTDTPQFSVTNNTAGTLSNARVRVFAWRFAGEVLQPSKPGQSAVTPAMYANSPSGILNFMPVGPRSNRRTVAPANS